MTFRPDLMLGLAVGLVLCQLGPTLGNEPGSVSPQAREIHESSLLFDGHNNLVTSLLRKKDVSIGAIDLNRFQQGLHTDIPRLRQGGVGAEYFATYVSSKSVKDGTAVKDTLEQVEAIKQLLNRYPEVWGLATTSDDIQRLRQERKVAGLIAIENGDAIMGSLAVLRSYYQAGVRCLAVTHDDTHGWADAALDKSQHGGLSSFGEKVVEEANRLGIVLDLSHASSETIADVLTISRAPVLFSHSAAHKVAPHPRNLTDDDLRLVAKNGGVVHVNFFPAFLTAKSVAAYKKRSEAAREFRKSFKNEQQYQLALPRWLAENPLPVTTVADVVDQIDHIVSVAGIDHVGLGSNFDGIVSVPKDLDDVSCFPRITQALLDRGYEPEQIRKILGENTLRVLRDVEQVAASSRNQDGTIAAATGN
jgi:membrane dipeptidase